MRRFTYGNESTGVRNCLHASIVPPRSDDLVPVWCPRAALRESRIPALAGVPWRGAYRNRTGVNGFAGRCVTTPPRRRVSVSRPNPRVAPRAVAPPRREFCLSAISAVGRATHASARSYSARYAPESLALRDAFNCGDMDAFLATTHPNGERCDDPRVPGAKLQGRAA